MIRFRSGHKKEIPVKKPGALALKNQFIESVYQASIPLVVESMLDILTDSILAVILILNSVVDTVIETTSKIRSKFPDLRTFTLEKYVDKNWYLMPDITTSNYPNPNYYIPNYLSYLYLIIIIIFEYYKLKNFKYL